MKLSHFDLNLLLVLDAIIKTRSITRASKSAGMRGPAMTGALGRLRTLLGDPVIEGVGRNCRLTPLAVQLAEPVQAILADIEHSLDLNSSFEPSTSQRVFRLAGSDYMAWAIFQPLLTHVARIAPGIQLCFQGDGGDTGRQLAALDLDLSLQPAEPNSGLESHHLFNDRFVCATWNGNPEVNGTLTNALFLRLGHVAYSHPTCGYTLRGSLGAPIAHTLRIQAVTESFLDLPFLLRGTSLIALVQERLASSLQAAADVRLFDCPVPLMPFKVSMWWNALNSRDGAHAWLRSTLVELAATGAAS